MNALAGIRTTWAGWLLVGPVVCEDPKQFGVGFVISGALSYLPDVEHSESTAGRAIGRAPSKIIRKIAGGHRGLTHSILFAFAASLFVWWVASDRFGWSLHWLAQVLAGDLLTGNLGGIWTHYTVFLGLVHPQAWAALIGVLGHIWCDMLTPTGCALFSPFSKRKYHIGRIVTGSRAEEYYVGLVNVLMGFIVLYHVTGLMGEINV